MPTENSPQSPGEMKPTKSRVRQNRSKRKDIQKGSKDRNYALDPEYPKLPYNKKF